MNNQLWIFIFVSITTRNW